MKTKESKLVFSAVDHVSDVARNISKNLSGVTNSVKSISNSMANVGQVMMGNFTSQLSKITTGLLKPAIDFEDAMSEVFKVFDEDAYKKLGTTQEAINKFATGLSLKMGKAGVDVAKGLEGFSDAKTFDDMKKMTEFALKLSTAFGIVQDESTEAVKSVYAFTNQSAKETQKILDTVNYVSNKSAQKAKDILKPLLETFSTGKGFGLKTMDNIAIQATLSKLDVESDVAKTTMQNLLSGIFTSSNPTKRQDRALGMLGYGDGQLMKDFNKNQMGTLFDFFDRVEKLNKNTQGKGLIQLIDLLGKESFKGLGILASNTETLAKMLKLTKDEMASVNAVQEEYNTKTQTAAYKISQLGNRVSTLANNFSRGLLPVTSDLADKMSGVVITMADWAEKNPETATTLVGVTTAVLGLGVAVGGLSYILGNLGILSSTTGGIMKGAFVAPFSLMKNMFKDAKAGTSVVMKLSKETFGLSRALGAFALYKNTSILGDFFRKKELASTRLATTTLKSYGGSIKEIVTSMTSLKNFKRLSIIALLGLAVKPTKDILTDWQGFVEGFKKNIDMKAIKELVTSVKDLGVELSKLFGLSEKEGQGWGVLLAETINKLVGLFKTLTEVIKETSKAYRDFRGDTDIMAKVQSGEEYKNAFFSLAKKEPAVASNNNNLGINQLAAEVKAGNQNRFSSSDINIYLEDQRTTISFDNGEEKQTRTIQLNSGNQKIKIGGQSLWKDK